MTEPLSPDRPQKLLTDLCRLVADRAPAEVEILSTFTEGNEATEREYLDARKEATRRYEEQRSATEAEHKSAREAVLEKFESDHTAVEQEYGEVRAQILAQFEAAEAEVKDDRQQAQWDALALSETATGGSRMQLDEIKAQLDARWQELVLIQQDAIRLLRQRDQWRDYPDPSPSSAALESNPVHRFAQSVFVAKKQLQMISDQVLPRFFVGVRPLGMVMLLWLASVYPSGLAFGWNRWHWVAVSAASALVLGAFIGGWLYRRARRQTTQAYLALRQTLVDAGLNRPETLPEVKAECEHIYNKALGQRNSLLKNAEDRFTANQTKLEQQKEADLRRADEKYPNRLAEIVSRRDHELQAAKDKYYRRLSEISQEYQTELDRRHRNYSQTMLESDQRFQREWGEMADRWRAGLEQFQSAMDEMNASCERLFPDWHTSDWKRWKYAAEIPPVIRFGECEVKLNRIEGGVPKDRRLRPAQTEFSLPAFLPFPLRSSLLLRADGEGRSRAIDLIQAVVLRMLTAIPPGKVRFTIIDPMGLGGNFSAFMHLADYDEQLVASRIWTDGGHIEQRLADLTEHMENVIQVYLRNEFESIQEYNKCAGEMAEPYRVLLVANFPANFSDIAARRLTSIVASGAKCGVFTLLSVDSKLQLPRDFDLADLEPHAFDFRWKSGHFECAHPDYGALPLVFPDPPMAERFTEIVRSVGSEVKDVSRVEVPFECVAPEMQDRWTADSRDGINVALGRASAMKLQYLNLGQGTSQHVLISGKTGSGKSTLLHALITNLSLRYSPDEIELYLVDFKKGVEFKTYATNQLPHARVIAIESEREFGLSVLQRLDVELRRRGDLFRKLGVQDLKSYRAAEPEATMPRVLLIIDEFQELFVEDDRISQGSALLLDRLVRQGRAFGIHVLLGSQTLGGAYSLARSTIGQMAVRIALQCSEADAHLILSEDNTAARLLTRPGEAIYNDANGLYEGNHPFQVVWLPDRQREEYLQGVRQLAQQSNSTRQPPIVFEGNVPADPGQNPRLHDLLSPASWPEGSPSVKAWLGAAIAIKDPTAAVFARQSGSNLLVVGHRDEAALGVLATCLISLAAQHAPSQRDGGSPARFYVLDGTRPDAPEVGFWNRVEPAVPHAVKIVNPRETAGVIAEIAAELDRREEAENDGGASIYLLIYNLGRFRDLRKDEDDFGFGSAGEDKPSSPAGQFAKILREGPVLGIHTIAWADTYNSVTRSLDRRALREIEMRVLFHVNTTDSSNLIDSPAASRLGVHRAIFYDEGQGLLEKFRPYAFPSDEWLAWVKKQLHARPAGCAVGSPSSRPQASE